MIFQNNRMANVDDNTRASEERIKNLEFQGRKQEPQLHTNQEQQGNAEGGSSRGGPKISSCQWTWSPNDAWLYFLFSYKKTKYSLVK